MASTSQERARPRFLERIGLHRPELRAWAMYDWANSAMATTIGTAIFPIYYYKVAGAGLPAGVATQRFAISTTIGLCAMALLAPILGALADYAGAKKRFLGTFLGIGVLATACMFFIHRGQWLLASALFITANLGASGSSVFYDSLLPHVARAEEMDRVSTAGYALGYLGGGLLLAFNLAWIRHPGSFGLPSGANLGESQATLPARLAFLSVAVWWLLFSIPLLRGVPEPRRSLERDEGRADPALRMAFARLRETFRELRRYRNALLMLVAFLLYNDGIATIIKMATIYGTEIGIGEGSLILAVLLVQFIGIPFSFLFGALAGRIGAKRCIQITLVVYTGISVLGYFMRTAAHFYLLAVAVAMVQGGSQALSRSLFASLIPKHKSSEFFGFFAVLEKFAGILGPALFAIAIQVTGSSRYGIVSVMIFFAIGAGILRRVDVEEGQRAARAVDLATHSAGEPEGAAAGGAT